MEQFHSKFKVFVVTPDKNTTDGIPQDLHLTMNGFIALNKVAVKSVGVEYVESIDKIVISLGYAENQESYSVVLQTVMLGKLDLFANLNEALEQALEKAANTQDDSVICHEFYVNKENNYVAFFLKTVK